jgi:peptide/nickel transport system substrate-binding protein
MDMRKPMWQDINVRKAFALSLPVQEGWLARGSTPGVTRIPGTTILPPGIPGRVEFDALGTGGDTPDPEQARQLLEEADAVGTKFKFSYSTEDPLRVDEKNAMVKGWKEAGFEPQPVAVSTTTDNTSMQQDPNSGLDVNSLGWCSDWPSGSSWFPPVFSSDGSSNYSYLRDEELDARMEEIQTMPVDEQPAAWAEMDEQIMTDIVPVAHYGYGGVAMLHGSAVQGMENDNVLGQPTFRDMWLQE